VYASSLFKKMTGKRVLAKYILVREESLRGLTDITVPEDSAGVKLDDKLLFFNRDQKINLRNGMISLRKKLGLPEIPNRVTGLKLPDDFFKMIDPGLVDSNRVGVYGTITKEALKRRIKEVMTKNCNAAATNTVMEKGADKAVLEGHYPLEKLPYIRQGEQMLREIESEEKMRERELENGRRAKFTVYKTGKKVRIVSHKGEGGKTVDKHPFTATDDSIDMDEFVESDLVNKKKHYLMYSEKPGYGKTRILVAMKKNFNCSSIADFNNLAGVRENSQFLTVDEFDHSSKLTLAQLKAFTSGDPDSFAGNKKSFGASFKPRNDAQLIIAGNHHLFACVGSSYDSVTKGRCMDHLTAKQLFDRFHIIKFDDETVGELEHGASLLAVNDDVRYEDFFKDDDDLEEFAIQNRDLVDRFTGLIEKRVYKRGGKKRKDTEDDDDLEPDGEYLELSEFDSRGRRLNKPLYRRFLNNLARRLSWE
jgi:hypothetical protein